MRRYVDKFDALIERLSELFYYPAFESYKNLPNGTFADACFEIGTTFSCQNMLSMKQWDKYYWPYAKPVLDVCVEKGFTYPIFPEGEMVRFADYFPQYPKGNLSFMLEKDDVFEFRKKIPNCAIMGGMDDLLLAKGTKQQ